MSTRSEQEAEFHTYGSGPMRWLLIGLGTVFVGIGVLGIILPLLPGTPFLLLAAACYARSSRRFYLWLLNNRTIGPLITEYRRSKRIPAPARRRAIAVVVTVFAITTIFVAQTPLIRALYALCGVLVLSILLRVKTVEAEN